MQPELELVRSSGSRWIELNIGMLIPDYPPADLCLAQARIGKGFLRFLRVGEIGGVALTAIVGGAAARGLTGGSAETTKSLAALESTTDSSLGGTVGGIAADGTAEQRGKGTARGGAAGTAEITD